MSDLGINDHHQKAIVNYIRFARFQRVQCLRTVASCFKDIVDTRLTDETYIKNEIEELLTDAEMIIRSEVESELINSSHTTAVLLRQLFQQAEQWHLKLQADTSELENSDLLKQIKCFEEEELMGTKRDRQSSPVRTKLEPLNESAGTQLLQKKIDELMEENTTLQGKLRQAETQAIAVLKERSLLNEKINVISAELELLHSDKIKSAGDQKTTNMEVEEMHKQIEQLKTRITTMETDSSQTTMENELKQSKKDFLKVQMQLETAQQELEKQFNQTAAYNNMKKMLVKKNEQIKELRRKLNEYEPSVENTKEE